MWLPQDLTGHTAGSIMHGICLTEFNQHFLLCVPKAAFSSCPQNIDLFPKT